MEYIFSAYVEYPKRIDLYLSRIFTDFSRSYIQNIINNWSVEVNWKIIKKNLKISHKDEIKISIKSIKSNLEAENIPLNIVYQDENIAIINKDPGIITHPVPWENGKTGTLVNALLHHINDLASIWWVERPGIVHRLDKDTSGLIMIAKNDKSMVHLQDLIRNRKIEKYYIAVVSGIMKEKIFKIESYIGRHRQDKTKMTVIEPLNPKIAITHWEVLWYFENKYSILRLKLETGRTHQIRVHLASIWHPIIWDIVYGDEKINKNVLDFYWLTRQALHAYELRFEMYGKKQRFIWDVKEDMKRFVEKINYFS